jgi:hypothetical protein
MEDICLGNGLEGDDRERKNSVEGKTIRRMKCKGLLF